MGFATIGEGFYTIANSFNSNDIIKSYDVKKQYKNVRKKYKKVCGVKK